MEKYSKIYTKEKNIHPSINPSLTHQQPPQFINQPNQFQYQPPQNFVFSNADFPNATQNTESIFDYPSVNPRTSSFPELSPYEILDPSLQIPNDLDPNPYENLNLNPQYQQALPNPTIIPPANPNQSPYPIPAQNYQQPFIYQQPNQQFIPYQPQFVNQPNQQQNQLSKKPSQKVHKKLTPEEIELKKIAEENRDLVKSKKFKIVKSETITENEHNSILYRVNQKRPQVYDTQVIVNKISIIESTIQMHDKYKGKKICILSFADPFKPGGGYLNGRIAQEETICRQTLLYPTICESNMYKTNKENIQSIIDYDTMIYSPEVTVIRNDKNKLLKKKSFTIDVISSPAVDNRNNFQNAAFIMERRIRRIIFLAIDKGVDVLILGAFGCGLLKNDPSIISQIFKKILFNDGLKNFFKVVVFSIYKSNENFIVFNDAFK